MKVLIKTSAAISLVLFLFVSCAPSSGAPNPSADTIRIASFNLQVFGTSKAGNAALLGVYAKIIKHFDIVAVQEIRDASGTALPALMSAINADGSHYDSVVGPRLGRTSSKEQYAFIFNTAAIQLLPGSYTFDDDMDGNHSNDVDDATLHPGVDLFEREPFVAEFKVTSGNFGFVLINIHTKPEDATAEIGHLPEVMADAAALLGEKDVICLGDFNADGSYFNESTYATIFPSSTYDWLIPNSADTTVAASSNTYDRITVTKSVDEDFDGTAGVYSYDQAGDLGSSGLSVGDVSDHYPVYAEFWEDRDSD
jgi:deoxyribonuclease-1-like protein